VLRSGGRFDVHVLVIGTGVAAKQGEQAGVAQVAIDVLAFAEAAAGPARNRNIARLWNSL